MEEICASISNLSQGEMFSYLYRHVQPPSNLPATFLYGANRKFGISWVIKFPWILYSPKVNGIFCGPCAILLPVDKRKDKGLLVNRPFSNWIKLSSVLNDHSKLKYHRDCLQLADTIKSSVENPASRVDVMTSNTLQAIIKENEHILKQIVRAIIFLSKQAIAFRGNSEVIDSSKNPGNFLALLKVFAESDEVLYNHLHNPKAKNAKHLSPQTQNELINIIGYDVILSKIVSEIKKAKYYSVLADEVSCHHVEHLPICVRFLDANNDIREEFISFIKLERVRAMDIVNAIVQSLEGIGLSLDNLRGQGYDGASTMSGVKAGVQAIIQERQPKALYTHCAGHYITNNSSFCDIESAASFYSDDLPNASILDEEFHRWKVRWLKVTPKERPQTLSEALRLCSPDDLPNLFTLMKLFATLPLSSCSCERSASALRRINNYLRSTQTAERLTSLALIHMSYEIDIDIDTVCKLYLEKYPRRIKCASLLFQ